jgi:uncharacterized DUF497 family protein
MTKWNEFVPEEIEYDFENDKLQKHGLTIDESVQCFYNPYTIRKNKKYNDRFKMIGKTDAGRTLCIIFQLKKKKTIRIITGWEQKYHEQN